MERNYSLDLFRIFSMLLIITLHVLGPSNMGGDLLIDDSKINYYFAWGFETFCFCGVNCFAMLSGYLCVYKEKMDYKRILGIYGLLLFYSLIFLLISYPNYEISYNDIYKCILPFTSRQDWFTTSYIGVFFLIPYINKMIINLNQNEFKRLLLFVLLLFVLFPILNLNRIDLFATQNGFSFLWLCVMYLFGAYQRLFPKKYKYCLLIIFISTLCAFSLKLIVLFVLHRLSIFNHDGLSTILIKYTSPFMVLNAYMLLNIFINKRIVVSERTMRIIKYFSSTSFAVLMIHTNQCALLYILKDRLNFLKDINTWVFILVIPLIACMIYLICSLIEGLRIIIFRLTKFQNVIDKLQNWIIKLFRIITNRIIKKGNVYE